MSRVAILLCALLAAGCDSESRQVRPPEFERAKLDCAPHGGLKAVDAVLVLFKPDRVDATCQNGARISREGIPHAR